MNPVTPRFGGFGDNPAINTTPLTEEQLLERMASLESTIGDIQFQNSLTQMPVDELVIQLGRENGSSAITRTDKSKPATPDFIPMQGPDGQMMALPLELVLTRMLGLDENGLQEYTKGFQDQVETQKVKLIEAAQHRIEMIREELQSRITIAQGLGKDEVPYASGEEGKDKRGIEVSALERLLDRTA